MSRAFGFLAGIRTLRGKFLGEKEVDNGKASL